MPPVNDFLGFAQGGGANVEAQATYAADPLLAIGNQPGVALSAFNNKALRQANAVSSQIAQFMVDTTSTDAKDDTNNAKLLAQFHATFDRLDPIITQVTATGAFTYNLPYHFYILSGNATANATYTNNGVTYTVVTTVAAGVSVIATGNGAPLSSGTLTKTGGVGDATLTFYAVRAPKKLFVDLYGAGGGGGGTGTAAAANGAAGGDTTFGAFTAHGGAGGVKGTGAAGGDGGAGGSIVGSGNLNNVAGQRGSAAILVSGGAPQGSIPGAAGGQTPLSGGGVGINDGNGGAAASNTGSGGSGGAGNNSVYPGAGGGSGAYVSNCYFGAALLSTFAGSIGAKGAGGAAGTSGNVGGDGADGYALIRAEYQ